MINKKKNFITFDLHDLCGNYCAVVDLKLHGVEDSHGKHRSMSFCDFERSSRISYMVLIVMPIFNTDNWVFQEVGNRYKLLSQSMFFRYTSKEVWAHTSFVDVHIEFETSSTVSMWQVGCMTLFMEYYRLLLKYVFGWILGGTFDRLDRSIPLHQSRSDIKYIIV